MFDVSFAEVLVVVTGAGLLLGKREILQGSRLLGHALGRGVGFLHGARMKYEQKSHGTRVYQMHKNVKKGLDDMSTIGRDLQMVGSGNLARSPSASLSRGESPRGGTSDETLSRTAVPTPVTPVVNMVKGGDNEKLARLILVEEKLHGSDWDKSLTSMSDTSDVVQSAITGSIMHNFYSSELIKEEEKARTASS